MEYLIERNSTDELIHYGVKGMKWGIRKDREGTTGKGIVNGIIIDKNGKKHEYTTINVKSNSKVSNAGKQRYSDSERKQNGEELNYAIRRSREKSSTGRPSAKEVWESSSTMKKFSDMTRKDYQKRNDIYDGKIPVPKDIKSKSYVSDDELRYYGYGSKFEKIMRKKASELVYDEKDVESIMKLVEKADWDQITDTYNDKAWLYWH